MGGQSRIEFLLLGPLEVRADGLDLPVGGAKQRTVLGLLLLHAGRVVPVDRLADAVWGESPPRTAAHTLESHVSRLRGALEPYGPTLVRVGNGYRLDLGDAFLDAAAFEELVAGALEAAERHDHGRASELASRALALWHGPALSGTGLRSEAERLEELRLRAVEQHADAGLALGRHDELVGALRRLVDEHPYRERFVGQLMLALYRAGRQSEALAVYEATRRRLDVDLGLRPGEELRRLSADVVRQDPALIRAARSDEAAPRPFAPRRWPVAAALFAVTALALGIVLLGAGGSEGGGSRSLSDAPRVALVLPRPLRAGGVDAIVTPLVDGLRRAERQYGVGTETLVADELDARAPSVERTAARLRAGEFDLVIASGVGNARGLAPVARLLPATRFAFLDLTRDQRRALGALPNVTAFAFADAEAGYLAGYLGGLVEGRRGRRLNGANVVSVVGGMRLPSVEALVEAFARGARHARPGITIRTAYSGDFVHQRKCAAIANRQISAGSDIVFAAAGTCGLGALRAAGLRGVWGIGADADLSYLGQHILASAAKRFDQAVVLAVRSLVHGTLRGADDVVLGFDQDAVGITGIAPEVTSSVRAALARVAESPDARRARSS